jgi:hypothetical protein
MEIHESKEGKFFIEVGNYPKQMFYQKSPIFSFFTVKIEYWSQSSFRVAPKTIAHWKSLLKQPKRMPSMPWTIFMKFWQFLF